MSLPQGIRFRMSKLSDKFRAKYIRPRLTVLSVSLLNGRFKAMSIINDTIHESWEAPGIVLKSEGLRQAISDAIHHTKFPGSKISILVDSKRFITHTLQLPPMPLPDLMPILERKAQEIKTFEGPAVWRYHLGIQARGKQTVHLEIWPQYFVDEVIQICEAVNLQLQQLASLSALSESQLGILPVEPGEATLLISVLEGKVMFVAGKDNGTPLIIRHLAPAHDWVPLGERVGTEINRTIMFINQQTNLNIPQIWFLGEDARLTLEEVQPHVATPILPCPINPDAKYWLWVGATLPLHHSTNFTPEHVLRAPLRNLLTTTAAAAVAGILLFGVGTAGMIQGYFVTHQDSVRTVTEQNQALQKDQQHWQGQLVTLQKKREWIQTVTRAQSPSLSGPFLGYLGTILPQHTILKKASITRNNAQWDVELTGSMTTSLSESLSLLEHFTEQLANGPYHMAVQQNWQEQLLTQTNTSPSQRETAAQYQFTLKGHIT